MSGKNYGPKPDIKLISCLNRIFSRVFFRSGRPFLWLATGLTPCMKLHIIGTANRRISNKKFRIMKCGIAALSLFLKNSNDRIPYFEIHYSLFDIRYSLFQSFFSDLTGPSRPEAALTPDTLSHLSWHLPYNFLINMRMDKSLQVPKTAS